MKKVVKVIVSMLCVVTVVSACAIPAFAASDAAIQAARRGRAAFEFTIENGGSSAYSPEPAEKTDGLHAWVSPDSNPVYWPSEDGVVFRVRNEKRQYATEAKAFDNGSEDTLDYFSNQSYYGTKWLYGSISDSKAGDYSLGVSGEWIP